MDKKIDVQKVQIDGKTYVPEESAATQPNVNRAVIVVDRGWIFAGDVTEIIGRIKLTRAVWVFNWSNVGFDGVLANPKDSNVKIRKLAHTVDIPSDSEIFRVPVSESWGL